MISSSQTITDQLLFLLFSSRPEGSCDGTLAHLAHIPGQFDFVAQIAAVDNDIEGAFDPPAREPARHLFRFDATRGFQRGHIKFHVARLNSTCFRSVYHLVSPLELHVDLPSFLGCPSR
jgi:hypothetical protein